MVQTLINLNEKNNQVVNIIKGQMGFSNKSEAINFIIGKFRDECMEPGLIPDDAYKK